LTPMIAYVILGQFNLISVNMISEIFSIINVVDIIVLCVFVRSIYIGYNQGLMVEFFKMLGIVFATFFSLHYFVSFALFLGKLLPLPMDMVVEVAYVTIWIVMVALFAVVRQGWMLTFKPFEKTFAYRMLGGGLGTVRAAFITGLLFLAIFISSSTFFVRTARSSLSGFYLKDIAVSFYTFSYKNFIVKVFPKEPINEKVFEFYPEEMAR